MPTYTSDANLLRELPETLPEALDTEAERLPYITEASALADALVGPRFPLNASGQRFANITDTPPTPPLIEMATRFLAASLIFAALHTIGGGEGPPAAESLRDEALTWFARIRDGEISLTGADGDTAPTSPRITSTTRRAEPTFRVARYDSEGSLLDAVPGSLDRL